MLSISWTHRFFYHFNSDILSRTSWSYFRWENLHTFWLLYMIAIHTHVLYLYQCDNVKLPNWEPIATVFLSRPDLFDDTLSALVITVCTLGIYAFYILYTTPWAKLETGRVLHDLALSNVENYRDSMPIETFRNIRLFTQVLMKPQNPLLNWSKFTSKRLPHLSHLSAVVRIKLAYLQTVLETFIIAVHYLIVVFVVLLVTFYFPIVVEFYYNDPYYLTLWVPILLFDAVELFALLVYFSRIFVVIMCLATMISLLYILHLGQLALSMRKLVRRINHSDLFRIGTSSYLILRYFLSQHTKACYQVLCINRQLVSRIMFTYIGISIPSNIYLVTRILYKQISFVEKGLFFTIILFQVISLILLLFPIAALHKRLHQPKPMLVAIQRALHQEHLIGKLKVDSLFYRLVSGRKYGMTVGPLDTVTHHFLLEVFFVYVGYFVFVTDHKI